MKRFSFLAIFGVMACAFSLFANESAMTDRMDGQICQAFTYLLDAKEQVHAATEGRGIIVSGWQTDLDDAEGPGKVTLRGVTKNRDFQFTLVIEKNAEGVMTASAEFTPRISQSN